MQVMTERLSETQRRIVAEKESGKALLSKYSIDEEDEEDDGDKEGSAGEGEEQALKEVSFALTAPTVVPEALSPDVSHPVEEEQPPAKEPEGATGEAQAQEQAIGGGEDE